MRRSFRYLMAFDPLCAGQDMSIPALSFRRRGYGRNVPSDVLAILETVRSGGAPLLSADTVQDDDGRITRAAICRHCKPASVLATGWSVVTDPIAAQAPCSAGTIKWGGVHGPQLVRRSREKVSASLHSPIQPSRAWGQFTVDLAKAGLCRGV